MEKEQTNLLGNLYTLRAGLSVISQEWDKINIIHNKILTEIFNSSYNAFKYLFDAPHTKFYGTQYNIPYQVNTLLLFILNYTGESFTYGYYSKSDSLISKDNLLSESGLFEKHYGDMILLPVKNFDYPYAKHLNKKYNINTYFNSRECSINDNLVKIIITCWLNSDECENHFKKVLNELTSAHNTLNKGLNKIIKTRQIKFFVNEIKKINLFLTSIPPIRNNFRSLIEAISKIKQNCESLLLILQKKYSPILDIRDWKHLDLIIFYLETRRADSIKEALQLVDREVQTQRIENAIRQATEQICNTLAIGFTVLQQTIENSYRALSAQISASTATISSQLANLTGAVNMNNALRAKANVSSQQLMNDVHALRNYIIR